MVSMSSTPKNHTYTFNKGTLSFEKSASSFEVGRYVKPVNRHVLTMQVDGGMSLGITLQPTQHWKVEAYDHKSDLVTLVYKYTKISIPMIHAGQMFQDYDQTSDGKRLYKVQCGKGI